MSDLYMVTVEDEVGSFFGQPEGYDTAAEATARATELHAINKEKFVMVYSCNPMRTFKPIET